MENDIDGNTESEKENNEGHSPSLVTRGQCDPDWEPVSAFLQRKLQTYNSKMEVTYLLGTRPVNGSGIEIEWHEELCSTSNVPRDQEAALDVPSAVPLESSDQALTTTSHSYNSRSRTRFT